MRKNNVPETTNLLQYWLVLEIFGMKALDVDFIAIQVSEVPIIKQYNNKIMRPINIEIAFWY